MDFFKKRGVALAVLVIAIVGAVFIGQSRKDSFIANKPTELLDVAYQNWICDDADLLSDQTEQLIRDYNGSWNGKYYAITAVATIDHLAGWDGQDYAAKLGETWGLGSNDMILLLVKDGDWQVYCGDNVGYVLREKHPGFLWVVGRFKSLLIGADGEKYSPEGFEDGLTDGSKYVDNVILHNNQNPYTMALIVPNKDALREYAQQKGLDPLSDGTVRKVGID